MLEQKKLQLDVKNIDCRFKHRLSHIPYEKYQDISPLINKTTIIIKRKKFINHLRLHYRQ